MGVLKRFVATSRPSTPESLTSLLGAGLGVPEAAMEEGPELEESLGVIALIGVLGEGGIRD